MQILSHRELTGIVTNCAQHGRVNLEAIETAADMHTARQWSSYFRVAVQGLPDVDVMRAIKAAKAKGKRTFRTGVGLWLTDKEFAA